MLEFCGRKFTCDECPICEGVEHRLRAAREGGYEPQLEYCGCDKVQTEFFISGYCSDAFEADKPQGKLCEPRKTGRAYRRKMRKQKKEKLMRIMTYVVRLIYQMFYDDKTIPEICYILNQQGIPSPRGGQWTYSTVKTILTNEKYSGDVLMQKTVTVDIFSHRSIRNDGRANQFFIQGYHEAIIPRELWLEVQQILKGENVVPVPSVDEVADLSASDVPRILDGFFVIKPRKDGNNEYLRQL